MKDIPGFEGRYAATEDGQVWSYPKLNGGKYLSFTKGRWLKQSSRLGWLFVCLGANNKKAVHRLVAETYLVKIPGKNDVNHKNGIKSCNNIENLEWVTRSENVAHAWKNGLRTPSIQKKKLNKQKIEKIKSMVSNGTKRSIIENKFKISKTTFYKVMDGTYNI